MSSMATSKHFFQQVKCHVPHLIMSHKVEALCFAPHGMILAEGLASQIETHTLKGL